MQTLIHYSPLSHRNIVIVLTILSELIIAVIIILLLLLLLLQSVGDMSYDYKLRLRRRQEGELYYQVAAGGGIQCGEIQSLL